MRANKFIVLMVVLFSANAFSSDISNNESKENESLPQLSNGVTTLGSIERLQGENMLLEIKVKAALLKKQLKENGINLDGTEIKIVHPVEEPLVLDQQNIRVRTDSPKLRLTEISGPMTNLIAVVSFGDGQQMEVGVGQRLPGSDLTVSKVTPSKVLLSDGSFLSL